MPPLTTTCAPGSKDINDIILLSVFAPASVDVNRMSTSARASAGMTFECVPPFTTLTVTVVPSSGSLSSCSRIVCFASSSTALTPFSGSNPACAARPLTSTVNIPVPFLAVFTLPPVAGGSITSVARDFLASASTRGLPLGLPLSSSQVNKIVI